MGHLSLQQAGAALRCGARASHRGSLSCCGAWALGVRLSVTVALGPGNCASRSLSGLSGSGARA